jgi:choline transport protein
MNWWMDITHSVYGGGIFCALIMIGLNFFIIVGTNLAGSRLAWSMARDKGLPYSEYFAHVSTRFQIPLRAMLAIVVIDLVIGRSTAGLCGLLRARRPSDVCLMCTDCSLFL